MPLLSSEEGGLLDEHFDVYLPDRWSSNLHNLTRMKAKDRVLRLAKKAGSSLADSGLHLESSSEIPSVWNGREVRDQWVFWVRDKDACKRLQPILTSRLDLATRVKAPADHFKHVLLCIRLDHEVVEVGVRLSQYATIDITNLLGRAEAEPEAFGAEITALDGALTLDGEPVRVDTVLSAARDLLSGERDWLVLSTQIKRDEALSLGLDLEERISNIVTLTGPFFRFCLWTEENDHIDVTSELDAFAQQARARVESTEAARTDRAQAHAERAEQARARTSAKVDAEAAWRRMQSQRRASIPPAVSPPEADKPAPKRVPKRAQRVAVNTRDEAPRGREKPPGSPKRSTQEKPRASSKRDTARAAKPRPKRGPAPTFAVGDMCRLTRGLFAGKQGEVRGEDKPGYYSVKVGVLEVKVSAYELEKLT
jgi:hypothetical protein